MEFATTYRQSRWIDAVSEVHFDTIFNLINDYKAHPTVLYRRVLEVPPIGQITINDEPSTFELYIDLYNKYPDVIFNFINLSDLYEFRTKAPKASIAFANTIESYQLLYTLMQYKVTDVLLGEPLVFDIYTINEYIKDQNSNCRIHILPIGKIPEYLPPDEDYFKHFWVLPQHLYLYDQYVDVCNIITNDITREDKLCELYIQTKEYHGFMTVLLNRDIPKQKANELNLIQNIDSSKIRSDLIQDGFALQKLSCRQKCINSYPSRCHACETQLALINKMRRMTIQDLKVGERK